MGFSPKYHFLTNQSRRKPHWSVSSNNKAMVTLPEVTLYKSHKKKSPLAIEITEIRKEPGFTNSVHPQLPGAQRVSNSRALEGHSFGSHKALASAGLTQLQWALLCSGRCKAPSRGFPKGQGKRSATKTLEAVTDHLLFASYIRSWDGKAKWSETRFTPQR